MGRASGGLSVVVSQKKTPKRNEVSEEPKKNSLGSECVFRFRVFFSFIRRGLRKIMDGMVAHLEDVAVSAIRWGRPPRDFRGPSEN